jgi:Holliday junction DNA helicase RuvA
MINRIEGKLVQVGDNSALVQCGGICYEVMVPTALADRLRKSGGIGEGITFETIYYIEAGDKKSSHFPRLVGFTDVIDREFFSMLTQVSGMGVKKALRSLILPIREIATAIENKDGATLSRMPGVGPRLGEKIIAELNGKTAKFALSKDNEPLAVKVRSRTPIETEALEVLAQLQYGGREAEQMISAAIQADRKITTVEALIEAIFKNEQKSQLAGQA